MNDALKVSLIATVKGEQSSLESWLAGLSVQERVPDEIVIVDGGSTDGTLETLRAWSAPCAVRIISHPGASISEGRNIALQVASGDVIAITDCGTVARPDWLKKLTEPFCDAQVDVVSGFFEPELGSPWDRALAAVTLPDASEIRPERFLPSSRSVAVRASWVRSGFLYPEWLDYCEDLIWDLQLRNAGARFYPELRASVRFRVRGSIRSFFRQYYLYARGDGKAGLFGRRHAIRYATYGAATLAAARGSSRARGMLFALAGVYLHRPIKRLISRDQRLNIAARKSVALIPVLPILMAIGDIAKMIGYPVGVFRRWQRLGTIHPARSWRRISPNGHLWNPAGRFEAPRPPEGWLDDQARSPERRN